MPSLIYTQQYETVKQNLPFGQRLLAILRRPRRMCRNYRKRISPHLMSQG